MAWPKGKPRKGYLVPKEDEAPEADPTVEPVLHGMVGSGAITEPCPLCLYAYADGGYCPDCGWMRPIRIDPYESHFGKRYNK